MKGANSFSKHIDLPNEELKIAELIYQLGKYADEILIKEIAAKTPNFLTEILRISVRK